MGATLSDPNSDPLASQLLYSAHARWCRPAGVSSCAFVAALFLSSSIGHSQFRCCRNPVGSHSHFLRTSPEGRSVTSRALAGEHRLCFQSWGTSKLEAQMQASASQRSPHTQGTQGKSLAPTWRETNTALSESNSARSNQSFNVMDISVH